MRDGTAPGMDLQARDIEIIRHVARHRFLRSTHILELVDGSKKWLLNRLHLLYHHGYLERPREQITYFGRSGSTPMVYGIGPKAAAHGLVERRHKQIRDTLFLEHTLGVADVMVGLALACAERATLRLIEAPEILAKCPERSRLPRPLRVRAPIAIGDRAEDVGIEPDDLFGLEFLDAPEGQKRAFFFLEVDRGTEPIVRTSLQHRTSILRKMKVYREAWRRWKTDRPEFGFRDFRVLFVTTGGDRIRNMREATESVTPGGSRLFLFATKGEAASAVSAVHAAEKEWAGKKVLLRAARVSAADPRWHSAQECYEQALRAARERVLSLAWLNGRGERVQLTD